MASTCCWCLSCGSCGWLEARRRPRAPPGKSPHWPCWRGAAIGLAELRYVQAADAARQADKIRRKLDMTLTEQFITTVPSQIPIGAADPIIGPAGAPHTVVVFEDFQCPTCAEVSTALHYIQERLGHTIRVVHKDFPLNADCNPSRRDMNVRDHDHACQAAAAAEAVRRLGGNDAFIRMRDMLFENQPLLPRQPYEDFARRLGLNVDEFNRLRASADVLREVQKDACVGSGLGVRSTPAVFLDGRLLKNPVIQRGPTPLLDETVEHWEHLLRSISFGAEQLGFGRKQTDVQSPDTRLRPSYHMKFAREEQHGSRGQTASTGNTGDRLPIGPWQPAPASSGNRVSNEHCSYSRYPRSAQPLFHRLAFGPRCRPPRSGRLPRAFAAARTAP